MVQPKPPFMIYDFILHITRRYFNFDLGAIAIGYWFMAYGDGMALK
jgi:hypothetical protein